MPSEREDRAERVVSGEQRVADAHVEWGGGGEGFAEEGLDIRA